MQKLFSGDLVHIDVSYDNRRHFISGVNAIVLNSYNEKYGINSNEENGYSLFLLDGSNKTVSWYYEDELLFREQDRFDLLPENHVLRQNYYAKLARDSQSA